MISSVFLIVDDDELLRSLLCRGLERRGHCTVEASSIAEARLRLVHHAINYAIIDLKLGQESGLLLIEEINRCHPDCRILMLTGYASIATAVDAVKKGAFQYLSKPATLDEILLALNIDSESSANQKSKMQITPSENSLSLSVNRVEWEHIQKVLSQESGNISATARRLGMHRRTLQRKLFKHPLKN